MPDQYGNPTEADYRLYGYAPPTYAAPAATGGYSADTQAAVRARADAARAGNGTIDRYWENGTSSHLTGSQLRSDPANSQLLQQMINSGRSDPNMLFGPTDGRTLTQQERDYRNQYRTFMENPNEGVDANEAARAVAIWATIALGGGALAGMGQGAAAGGAAGAGSGAAAGGGATGLGTGAAGGLQASSGLGVFANGGAGGLAGVGGGNAGALAASGGITGGAGTGFLGSLGGNGLLSQGSIANAGRLNGLLGGGNSGGSGEMPYMGFGSNYGQPTKPQQATQQGMLGSQTRLLPSMNQPLQSYGRKPLNFGGATIWV